MHLCKENWRANDIKILTTLYYMGATELEMSGIFNRSTQSINKKITRLKIRFKNTESHRINPARFFPPTTNKHDIFHSATTAIKQIKCETIRENKLNLIPHLQKKFPPQKKLKTNAIPYLTIAENNKGQWCTKDEIIGYLKEKRYLINTLEEHDANKIGYTYKLKNTPIRFIDLFIKANQIRLKLNEPLFYLEELTQE